MKIKLYSTGCPSCKVLEKVLVREQIPYEIIHNVESIMIIAEKHGIKTVPILEVGENVYSYQEAIASIKKIKGDADENKNKTI